MGYNVVPTAVTGDLWTAANQNTYVKDNFAAGVPDIFTAAGDIAYATAANAASPLAIGLPRQHLAVNAGATAPEWTSAIIGCNVWRNAAQSVASAANIEFDTEIYDTDDFFSTDNTDAVTIPYDGIYQLSGFVTLTAISGSNTYTILKAGNVIIATEYPFSTVTAPTINFCYTNRFEVGNDVYLNITHGSTSAEDVTCHYQVTYLGASI